MNRGNRTKTLWERFFRGFQRSSQRPSQRQISLSEALSPVAPNRVAPWTYSKRPGNRGFKKSAEIGHGSSAPLWSHRNRVKQVLWEPLCPWGEDPDTLWHKIIAYEKLFWNDYFWNIRNFTRNSLKTSFFPRDFEGKIHQKLLQK